MRLFVYLLACVCAAVIFLVSDAQARSSKQKAIDDPFARTPSGAMSGCDREQRFKYDVAIGSADDFIALLSAHQSKQQLHDFKPTQAELVPGYSLQAVGNDEKKRINLEDLKGNVQVFELNKSTLLNKKIFILQIGHQDYNEAWPWQVIITASDQGHVSVQRCAGM